MWTYVHTDELYHFGIKGQKWGVRRFQKADGALTVAGKKRYDDSPGDKNSSKEVQPSKSKHRLHLEEKYRTRGYSKKDAEELASKRIRTEKILAISAGLTVAACVAYVAHNKLKDRTDGLIKAGETLQRIEMQDTGGKLHDVFYTSKGKHDNARYKGLLGMVRQRQTGQAYLMNLEASADIKVASKDKAAKMFGELYKNDQGFRESVKEHVSKHFTGQNKTDPLNMSDRNIKKMYENFNANLVDIRESGSGADKMFYSKLKSVGYGAVQDINDMKYSGYQAKNPLIVFGNSSNVMVKNVTKMSGDKVAVDGMKELTKAYGEKFVDKALTAYGPMTATVLTGAAATKYVEDYTSTANETK